MKFLERFKKNCVNNKLYLNEENLGQYSSIILSKIISKSDTIFHLFL